jgi:hypothetical protein
LVFLGTNPAAFPRGIDRLEGYSNYLRRSQEVSRVPAYARASYKGVYRGVDLVYYGTAGRLEYDFILAPGVDPAVIRLRFEGAEKVRIDENGDLLATVADSDLRQQRPIIYQEIQGQRKTVRGEYVLQENGEICLALEAYDTTHALTVDPVLDFSSYLGRDDNEAANAIAFDGEGNVYVTGSVESSDFPVSANAFLANFGGDESDAFVSKFRPDGTSLQFSTFLGSESDDVGTAIAVDADGNVYVAGYTSSTGFPADGFQKGFAGVEDCFISKLAPDGASAAFSTYLGDGDEDRCSALAIDSERNVYVTGFTRCGADGDIAIDFGLQCDCPRPWESRKCSQRHDLLCSEPTWNG